MSDVEERIKSLEFRIQNIENQIQDLASNSNTRGKSSNGGRSVAVKCEKCKEPVNKIYTIIQDSDVGDYETWVGKSVCSNCIDNMEVNEADFEVKEENPDLLQASQKKCAKCGNTAKKRWKITGGELEEYGIHIDEMLCAACLKDYHPYDSDYEEEK